MKLNCLRLTSANQFSKSFTIKRFEKLKIFQGIFKKFRSHILLVSTPTQNKKNYYFLKILFFQLIPFLSQRQILTRRRRKIINYFFLNITVYRCCWVITWAGRWKFSNYKNIMGILRKTNGITAKIFNYYFELIFLDGNFLRKHKILKFRVVKISKTPFGKLKFNSSKTQLSE